MFRRHFRKAFRIIRRNFGCPGPDRLAIRDIRRAYNHHIQTIQATLEKLGWSFGTPNTVILTSDQISGQDPKSLVVYVYNVYDRWLQQCIKLDCEPALNILLQPRALRDLGANEDTRALLFASDKVEYVLEVDVTAFGESIDRYRLLDELFRVGLDREQVHTIERALVPKDVGLPNGNCLSPMLANFYLKPVDVKFLSGSYTRYGDDLFFGLRDLNEADELIEEIDNELERLNLVVNFEKTRVVDRDGRSHRDWSCKSSQH